MRSANGGSPHHAVSHEPLKFLVLGSDIFFSTLFCTILCLLSVVWEANFTLNIGQVIGLCVLMLCM